MRLKVAAALCARQSTYMNVYGFPKLKRKIEVHRVLVETSKGLFIHPQEFPTAEHAAHFSTKVQSHGWMIPSNWEIYNA